MSEKENLNRPIYKSILNKYYTHLEQFTPEYLKWNNKYNGFFLANYPNLINSNIPNWQNIWKNKRLK